MPGNWRMLGHVFLGGALGTMLRYLIFEVLATAQLGMNTELLAIFAVNLTGSLFLGLTARHPWFQSESCRNLWGVGFAGGFTTMSALTLFIGDYGLSWEIALMLFLGVMTYSIGYWVGKAEVKKDA